MGLLNLDDNINVQIAAFAITMGIFVEWITASVAHGFDGVGSGVVPAVAGDGSGNAYEGVVGIVMMSFAFVATVPSWVNIKVSEDRSREFLPSIIE